MTTDAGTSAIPLTTPRGLPGYDDLRDWVLEGHPDGVFFTLRSLERADAALIVAAPWELAPGYEPDLPDVELADLGISDPTQVQLLVVVGLNAAEGRAWANLAAPIVVAVETCQARQVVLDRQGWPVRHELTLRAA